MVLAYRVSFAGPSVGTEQEFRGVRFGKKKDDDRSLIAEVVDQNELLLQVTTDIGGREDEVVGYREYTMEIKTSPTEVTDVVGWGKRTDAIRALIDRIATLVSGENGRGTFATGALGAFDLAVHNPDHLVYRSDEFSVGVSGSSRHATVGMPFADLGTDEVGARLVREAHWYLDWAKEFDEIPGDVWIDRDRSLAAYNYVRSVLVNLAELTNRFSLAVHDLFELKKFSGNLYDSAVKNTWGVLPRTSPWTAVKLLAQGDRERLRSTLLAQPESVLDKEIWAAVVAHVTRDLALAGHTPTAPTYTNQDLPGTLFEFRKAIPVEFKHAFVLVANESGGFAGEQPEIHQIHQNDQVHQDNEHNQIHQNSQDDTTDLLRSRVLARRSPGDDSDFDSEE
ncbi:actin cross-linking domain-containing toxin [Actinokineospora globicatena]|uniref:actin cross-linking domain-containing toxin n=1 Tax=Actinokineospora globicatena TaxID=103729 RepID=UPI0020A29846|nr:actin cross-linking domain-containing toxin [Actinokineospora globicatena]MCP2303007.1 Actin cross-linking domain-containing protein [Actinokineospora globicatena]GLW79886.1 hypothetical protein Aglo01_43670 [Actinokineospora globicatena]GLW85704.1 hypothetical protein Aglo02_33440 [Actinokineospora globicatena]